MSAYESLKFPSMLTRNALTDGKMAVLFRNKLEQKAMTETYLLILITCSHGIVIRVLLALVMLRNGYLTYEA